MNKQAKNGIKLKDFQLECCYLNKTGTIVRVYSDGSREYDYRFQSPSTKPIFSCDGSVKYSIFPNHSAPEEELWNKLELRKLLYENRGLEGTV